MKSILALCLLFSTAASAQHSLAAFSVWKPKDGQGEHFEAGYKKHLAWHLGAQDKWNWYGWFIISGERDGLFVDATFGHNWADLDHRVDPAGDAANNALNTEPYADFLMGYKLQRLAFSDPEDSAALGATFLRMLTIDVSNPVTATALLETFAADFRKKSPGHRLLVYKKVDGGTLRQLVIFLGANNFEEYGRLANCQDDLFDLDRRYARPVITGITAETLVFRRDLSINWEKLP